MKRDTSSKIPKVTKDRAQFRSLIAANPSHFFDATKVAAKLGGPPTGNTTYEELVCLGYQSDLKLLEATVEVKSASGFSGDPCTDGSMEYVQFYIDYDDGNGWQDIGYAAFNTHDIPNFIDCKDEPDKPLTYVVTLPLDPDTKCCLTPVLPRVRAILSWESVPTGPNDPIVWGNGLDRSIQSKPKGFSLIDILKVVDVSVLDKFPASIQYLADKHFDLPEVPELELPQLKKLYSAPEVKKGKSAATLVEPHRFGFADIQPVLSTGLFGPRIINQKILEWQKLDLDWITAVAELEKTKGNVNYEELNCLGLDPNANRLVATFEVKKSSGYSGDLCSPGSIEYIAFWADWDDNCVWTYLGTAKVRVHDIASIPATGLHYAALLNVDLDPLRRPCTEPRIARIRAVLSWSSPPSTTDADAVPYWGNRIDAHIEIPRGQLVASPHLSIIGGIGVADIDTLATGMTLSGAKFALTGALADPWLGTRACPFAGQVVIQAPAKPTAQPVGSRYRIMARQVIGGTEQPVTTPFRTVDEYGSGTWRYADADNAYKFLSNQQNVDDVLAWWTPGGDDTWEVRLQLIDGSASEIGTSPWYRVKMDNTPPDASIRIDTGDCEEHLPGVTLTGHFVARDTHFGKYAITTTPTSLVPPPNSTSPNAGISQTATDPGDSWTLNTTGMVPCGYVLRLEVWDRAIRNSSQGNHNKGVGDVGFCLLEEEA